LASSEKAGRKRKRKKVSRGGILKKGSSEAEVDAKRTLGNLGRDVLNVISGGRDDSEGGATKWKKIATKIRFSGGSIPRNHHDSAGKRGKE